MNQPNKTNHNKYSEILGKPSGITLQQHTDNVLAEADYVIASFPLAFEKYLNTTGKDLTKRLKGAIKYHDEGKKHPLWQNACQKDYENFLEWQKINRGDFERFAGKNKELAGKNLRHTGVRHEINSLIRHINDNFSEPVKVAIAAHHSKLSRKHERRWIDNSSGANSDKLWAEFVNLNACFRNHHSFRDAVVKHYEFAGVRVFLQLSDRRASARENKDIPINFLKFNYTFPNHWQKRNVQKIAEQYSQEDLLLIRAPTGAGKTDASLLWASLQIANKKAERLIIAMPTRFTSNALSINVAENLSSTGLYHSSAWFTKFHKKVKSGKIDKREARKEHEMARQLLAPVTVCTIDHLLMALTLTREDQHTITFNLANSCVVIDEADFYDEFTQANILVLLEALKILKVPVMIMSASLPEASIEMYKTTGFRINSIKEDTSDNERIRCDVKVKTEYTALGDIEDLLQKCCIEGKAIIYANTVARAMEFYVWFKKRNIEPILYHSRFTEPHKAAKEKLLLDALGKEAWENGIANGIAILTQIGEMSVNISADIMISEVCPIDRLVQRAGRLSRFDKTKIGELYIVIPQKNEVLYPAPYGTYVAKQGWEANKALLKTIDLLECKGYSANDFVEFINIVYPTFENFQVKAKENATLLKQKFVSDWIILPLEQTKEDVIDSQEWKSRDIVGNDTVFVSYPDSDYFYYWQDFLEFKIENSVDISSYMVRKGIKNGRIITKKIKVADDEVNIFIALNSYSMEIGLQLTEMAVDDQFL